MLGCQGQPESAAKPALCASATTTVQDYRAPGQTRPLVENLAAQLAAEEEQHSVSVQGWEPPEAAGDDCYVGFRVVLGGEPRRLRWRLDTRTGQVEALDDLTRRLSGE